MTTAFVQRYVVVFHMSQKRNAKKGYNKHNFNCFAHDWDWDMSQCVCHHEWTELWWEITHQYIYARNAKVRRWVLYESVHKKQRMLSTINAILLVSNIIENKICHTWYVTSYITNYGERCNKRSGFHDVYIQTGGETCEPNKEKTKSVQQTW